MTQPETHEILRDPAELSFEEALEELEALTSHMAKGDMTLNESVHAYERGAQLLKRCRGELDRARSAIERIRVENPIGSVRDTSPLTGDDFF